MLSISADTLKGRATTMAATLVERLAPETKVRVVPGQSQVGAGSAPEAGLDTHLVAIAPAVHEVATVEASLRSMDPAVMLRVYDGELLVDLRTVHVDEEEGLVDSLLVALAK
jgi:L-seryl-tRNA(Ser) seleniumtransferase